MKSFKAKVISDKMTHTAVVSLDLTTRHPLYGKVVHKTQKLHVDNTLGAKLGEIVEIIPCKKLSKTKSHKIIKIIKE
jgi:Ribosomal protein S17